MSTEGAATTSTESADIPGGNGPVSFEELEAITAEQKESETSKADKKASKEAKAKEGGKGAEGKEKTGETKDLRSTTTDKAGEKKADTGKTEKGEGDSKEAKAADEAKAAKKTYKGKLADARELDLDEDAEFMVKINGQDVPVKASDLFSNYSGKVAWDKKFNELNVKNIGLQKDLGRLTNIKGQIKAMFEEKDPNVRLFKMAEIAGVSPVEFRKQTFDTMMKDLETYALMSDDEKKARDLEFENSYLKYNSEAQAKALATHQAQQAVESKVSQLLTQHKVPKEAFVQRYDDLLQLSQQQKEFLAKEGKFKDGEPTPEFMIETIQKDALWDASVDALSGVKLNMKPEEASQKLLMLVDEAHRNGFGPEDMPELVSEIWGKGRAKSVVDEKQKARDEHYNGKQVKPNFQGNGEGVWSFEQLF